MSDYLRFRRGTLQTPIHAYVHPRTGRRVAVIGTVHVGEPGYYAGLRAVIDGLEAGGAVVQCEGSSLLRHDEQDLTDAERAVVAARERKQDLERRRITELGWVWQIDALGYPDRWQIVDLSLVEIIRRAGCDAVLRVEEREIRMFDRPDGDPRSIERFRLWLHLRFTLFCFAARNRARRVARTRTPSSGLTAVLLDQRDALALDGLWSLEQDVVLIWGCGHLPGLAAGIVARGFVRAGDTQWHTAVTLPTIRSIRARLRTLPRAARDGTPATAPVNRSTQR